MTSTTKPASGRPRAILTGVIFRFILILSLSVAVTGQTPIKTHLREIYAGIELSPDGVRAVALRASNDDESPGLKLAYSEYIRLSIVRGRDNEFTPQIVSATVDAVQKLFKQLREVQNVPDNRIHLIGSNALGTENAGSLLGAIRKATGRTAAILDATTDVQLSIAGTIPQRDQAGEALIDVRNSSMLVEIGPVSTRAGYQLLRYLPPSPPRYEFVTMTVPQGVESLTQEVLSGWGGRAASLTEFTQQTRQSTETLFKPSLQKERDNKPGLLTRRRVYLSGTIVAAMVALMLPQERGAYVAITQEQITLFSRRALKDPVTLLNPELTQIRDRKARQEAERELALVQESLTPLQLVAGAELLRTVATEFEFGSKSLWYARYGNLSRLVSYIGLQIEK